MDTLLYIRDIRGKYKIDRPTTVVFKEPKEDSDSYQDLVKFYNRGTDRLTVYTCGKCLFPENFANTYTSDRWFLFYVMRGNMFFDNTCLTPGDFIFVPENMASIKSSKPGEMPLYYWCTSNDPMLEDALKLCGFTGTNIIGRAENGAEIRDIFEKMIYS